MSDSEYKGNLAKIHNNKMRRSARIATKPAKKYYTNEDEFYDVSLIIEKYCKKRNLIYSDELVDDFYDTLKYSKLYSYMLIWDNKIESYRELTILEKAEIWSVYSSEKLMEQKKLRPGRWNCFRS